MRLVLALLALAACQGRRLDKTPIDRAAADKLFEEIPVATPPGMSDLTIDERGVLWSISERDNIVVEIQIGKPPISHALKGAPPGFDTEAIAYLGNGRFAIGTEGEYTPGAGVLTAELKNGDVVVTDSRPLFDKDVGVTMTTNHGVEAVCGKDGELLAAIETVGQLPDGRRWAPIVRLRGNELHLSRLFLTTKRGKISGMTCTIGDDGVAQVEAIERHFGIVRLLKFTIGRDDVDITPTVDIDLFPILHDNFNMEGITRLPDGRLVLINDNQMDKVSGPTELFVFKK